MDPTERQDRHDRAEVGPSQASATPPDLTRARLERRAESLRANLKRRKAQGRGRAEAERATAED